LRRGHFTFGSFNNPAKINAVVVDAWSRILSRVPGSRLLLKYRGLTDAPLRGRITALFESCGTPPGRLELLDWSDHSDMLARYNDVDVALDPFPFAGGATTCEALWMGVPVVTCPGETFAGRHSLSYLSTVGLTEMIANDLDGYVSQAVRLVADLEGLNALRLGLRERMARSPLCDGDRLAGHLARLLNDICQEGQRSGPESLLSG
jgi:predicted O-linked N-acetylglucosamine transferase (SPINDLY family)